MSMNVELAEDLCDCLEEDESGLFLGLPSKLEAQAVTLSRQETELTEYTEYIRES